MPAMLCAPSPRPATAGNDAPHGGHRSRNPLAGLTILELEELLNAAGDREDIVGPDERARLARGRIALNLELADRLEE